MLSEAGLFDGFRVNTNGNLWSSAADGVHCFAPDGTLIGRSVCPRSWPTSALAGASATGCSSAPPPRSSPTTSTPAAPGAEETSHAADLALVRPQGPRFDRRHAAGRRRRRRLRPAPRPGRGGLDARGDRRRQAEVATRGDGTPSGIAWDVVESLPVSEEVKKQKGDWRAHLDAYRVSLQNLADAGIEVICYNFMPVLDWTRTDLAWRVGHGGTCMRFDYPDFAAFDIHILARARRRRGLSRGGPGGGRPPLPRRWTRRARRRSRATWASVSLAPPQGIALEDVRTHLAEYGAISPDQLRRHFIDFLAEVVPIAESPRPPPLLPPGRPAVPAPRPAARHVDRGRLRAILLGRRQPGQRRHALHRLARRPPGQRPPRDDAPARPEACTSCTCATSPGSPPTSPAPSTRPSTSAATPTWSRVIAAALAEERRRAAEGRRDTSIPFRPDHGQDILDDLKRQAPARLPGHRPPEGPRRAPRHPDRARPPGVRPLALTLRALLSRQCGTTRVPAGSASLIFSKRTF